MDNYITIHDATALCVQREFVATPSVTDVLPFYQTRLTISGAGGSTEIILFPPGSDDMEVTVVDLRKQGE